VTSTHERIQTITDQLPRALNVDRVAARHELRRLRQALEQKGDTRQLQARCDDLAKRVQRSLEMRRQRLEQRPDLRLTPICRSAPNARS
jgi:hypothetical protein